MCETVNCIVSICEYMWKNHPEEIVVLRVQVSEKSILDIYIF